MLHNAKMIFILTSSNNAAGQMLVKCLQNAAYNASIATNIEQILAQKNSVKLVLIDTCFKTDFIAQSFTHLQTALPNIPIFILRSGKLDAPINNLHYFMHPVQELSSVINKLEKVGISTEPVQISILLFWQDPSQQQNISQQFDSKIFNIIAVNSPTEALQKIKTQQPDLVILKYDQTSLALKLQQDLILFIDSTYTKPLCFYKEMLEDFLHKIKVFNF